MPLLVVAVLLLAVGCGVPAATWWTLGVDHGPTGAPCPECAVSQYFAAVPIGVAGEDAHALASVLCDDRRAGLRAQVDQFRSAFKRGAEHGDRVLRIETHDPRAAVDGQRATVTVEASLVFAGQAGGAMFAEGSAWPWTFDLTREDGWQVCGVQAPDPCKLVTCEAPQPVVSSSTPSASPREWSPLDGDPCHPDAPYREFHDCPTVTPRPS